MILGLGNRKTWSEIQTSREILQGYRVRLHRQRGLGCKGGDFGGISSWHFFWEFFKILSENVSSGALTFPGFTAVCIQMQYASRSESHGCGSFPTDY